MANVKLLNYESLTELGFTPNELEAAKNHPDGYVGTKGGIMYFRSDIEFKMGDLEFKGSTGSIVDMQGEGTNRKGPPSPPRE